jgi:hypothetical protein
MKTYTLLACAAAVALAGCSTTSGSGNVASAATKDWTAPVGKDGNVPFPSTYTPYPGRPTALVGATVFDGRGGRIDNGTVLFRDGKVVTPKKTNQRDLRRKRPPPRDRQMPLHLAENNPPPASKEAVPINRRAARARASEDSPKDD